MADLLHQLVERQCMASADRPAVWCGEQSLSYVELQDAIDSVAQGLLGLGLQAGERVAVYLPKVPETVTTILGAAAAGCVFVPVNPLLKPRQVAYILSDCNVRVLVTSAARHATLAPELAGCGDLLATVIVEDAVAETDTCTEKNLLSWNRFTQPDSRIPVHRRIDTDMVAILYTSGSTGQPKGVVLSHRNMVAGAASVAEYLENSADDIVLAILPLSFDAGLSQLTTMFTVGGSAVLMDYLLPQDVPRAVDRYQVTGLAAVPAVWNRLARLEWPDRAVNSLRYITNTGGAMPTSTTRSLIEALPRTRIFLMYGLTEAFRSTYLPPEQVAVRPESIGKAIPNAEILVINEQGMECAPNEPGELVHRGALVAMGYWNAPEKTAERFRPCPGRSPALCIPEIAVWSGDRVYRDEEGYLYFVSREDEMIKTSGYRVSPTEVEEVVYGSGLVTHAVAVGVPHAMIGQGIIVICVAVSASDDDLPRSLLAHCRAELPGFMVPGAVICCDEIPTNQNGKLDRKALAMRYSDHFKDAES